MRGLEGPEHMEVISASSVSDWDLGPSALNVIPLTLGGVHSRPESHRLNLTLGCTVEVRDTRLFGCYGSAHGLNRKMEGKKGRRMR